MNSFLKKIAYFLIPFLVVFFAIECFYRVVPNNYSYKNQQIKQYYKSAKTLVFGDSHAFYGLNPDYFSSPTFNASNVSQSVYFDQLLFNKHVDSFQQLKNVVLTVAYTTLSEEDDKLDLKWRKYFYQKQMNLEVSIIKNYDPKKYSLALVNRVSETIKYLKDYIKDGTLATSYPNGFITTNLVEKSRVDLDVSAIRVTKKHEDGLLDFSQNTKRIQEIITACKARGINVFLVSYPVNYRYADLIKSIKLAKMYQVCNVLAKINSNVTYINLFEDKRFEDSDFFDANHLNVKGAEKCSKILAKIIQ
ncbi:hypothetical protein [Olleya sp. R77988]|uniref:hypothetical protein n=1 Tax=Olleya sp. R77988 TaxID=3093875 RepID=UPI0037C53D1B